jgi:hypothetical protein
LENYVSSWMIAIVCTLCTPTCIFGKRGGPWYVYARSNALILAEITRKNVYIHWLYVRDGDNFSNEVTSNDQTLVNKVLLCCRGDKLGEREKLERNLFDRM